MPLVSGYADYQDVFTPYVHQPSPVAASYNLSSPDPSFILHDYSLFTGPYISSHSHVEPGEPAIFTTTFGEGAEVNLHSSVIKLSQVGPASVGGTDVCPSFSRSGAPRTPPVIAPIDPAMERAIAATFTVGPVRCKWGVPCGRTLAHCTPAGVARHLQAFHRDSANGAVSLWRNSSMGACQWSVGGIMCGKAMFVHGYAKHVACVHLRSTQRQCPRCLRTFARSDALKRHSKKGCRA